MIFTRSREKKKEKCQCQPASMLGRMNANVIDFFPAKMQLVCAKRCSVGEKKTRDRGKEVRQFIKRQTMLENFQCAGLKGNQ